MPASLEPDAHLGKDIVDKALVARAVGQPVDDVVGIGGGSIFGGAFMSGLLTATSAGGAGYVVFRFRDFNGVLNRGARGSAPAYRRARNDGV